MGAADGSDRPARHAHGRVRDRPGRFRDGRDDARPLRRRHARARAAALGVRRPGLRPRLPGRPSDAESGDAVVGGRLARARQHADRAGSRLRPDRHPALPRASAVDASAAGRVRAAVRGERGVGADAREPAHARAGAVDVLSGRGRHRRRAAVARPRRRPDRLPPHRGAGAAAGGRVPRRPAGLCGGDRHVDHVLRPGSVPDPVLPAQHGVRVRAGARAGAADVPRQGSRTAVAGDARPAHRPVQPALAR